MRETATAGCEDGADVKLLVRADFVRAVQTLLMRLGRRWSAAACQDVAKAECFLGVLVERADWRGLEVAGQLVGTGTLVGGFAVGMPGGPCPAFGAWQCVFERAHGG